MALVSSLATMDPSSIKDVNGDFRFEFVDSSGTQTWLVRANGGQVRLARVSTKASPDAKVCVTLRNADISSIIRDATKQLNAVLRWNLELEDKEDTTLSIIIDAKNVDSFDKKDDVSLTMKKSTAIKIGNGELNPQSAFMEGKIKLMGNMAIAMKLATLQATMESRLLSAKL